MNLNKILNNWSLPKVTKIKKAKKGNVNHNWIIETKKKKFVLRKVHQDYKPKNLEFELNYLDKLKEKLPCSVPHPIKTKNLKNFIINKEGLFWLYEYIEGIQKSKYGRKELSEIARITAKYHLVLEKLNLDNKVNELKSYNKKNMQKEFSQYLRKIPKNKNKERVIFLKNAKNLLEILDNLDESSYNSLNKYPIHRDLNPENLLWEKEKITAIIDFDNVSHVKDALIRDLAVIMQYFCSDKNRNFILKKAKFLLNEYIRYKPLTKKEIKIIPDLLISTYIEDFGYAYWMSIHDEKRSKKNRMEKYSRAALKILAKKDSIIKELIK